MAWYYWLILIIAGLIIIGIVLNKQKRERLMNKYDNEILVEKLMNGEFWQGQTKSELIDSLGKPENINEQVLKTKTKETYKYNKEGSNRYKLKIHLEDDIVVGWDKK
tara:strand:+ start:3024 stop:3344 length:321 start_codon:yes stop_codon:yes gene_type:complete